MLGLSSVRRVKRIRVEEAGLASRSHMSYLLHWAQSLSAGQRKTVVNVFSLGFETMVANYSLMSNNWIGTRELHSRNCVCVKNFGLNFIVDLLAAEVTIVVGVACITGV